MNIEGLGHLGYEISQKFYSRFHIDPDMCSIAKLSQYFVELVKKDQFFLFEQTSSFEILLLLKFLFYTGKWNTSFFLVSNTRLLNSWWHFFLLLNADNIEKASILFDNLEFPFSVQTREEYEIIGWTIRYHRSLNQLEEVENMIVKYRLIDTIDSDISRFPDEILTIIYNLALVRINQRSYDEGLNLLMKCENEAKARKHYFWLAQAFLGRSTLHYQKNEIEQAIFFMEQSIKIDKLLDDTVGLFKRYSNLGTFYEYMGDYNSALENYRRAKLLMLSEEIPSSFSKWIQASIADILFLQGNIKKAEDEYLQFFEKCQDQKDSAGIMYSLNKLGILSQDSGSLTYAQKYFREGLERAKASGDLPYEAIFINNLGRVLFKKGSYQEALDFYKKSLTIFEQLENRSEVARVKANIASIYFNTGNFSSAEQYAFESMAIFQAIENPRGLMYIKFILVDVYLAFGRYLKAKDYCIEALNLAKQVNDALQVAYGYGKLGEVEYYLESDKVEYYIQKGVDMYRNLETYNLDYSQLLFFKFELLSRKDDREGIVEIRSALKKLNKHLKSEKVDFFIRYSHLFFMSEKGSLNNMSSEQEKFIAESLERSFFSLHIKASLMKIKIDVQRKRFNRIQPSIEIIVRLAKERNLNPLVANCQYLSCLLNYYLFDFEKAIAIADSTIQFCEKQKLSREVTMVKEIRVIIKRDMKAFSGLYEKITTEPLVTLRNKVTDFSEKMIHAFVSDELRIYVPEEQTKTL